MFVFFKEKSAYYVRISYWSSDVCSSDLLGVVCDHRIGSVEDVGAGAVVLLQPDGLRAREVLEELLHVLDLGAAPAVDRLVVVADHKHVRSEERRGGQECNYG